MGLVYADIELINSDDLAMVRRNIMDKDEVRRIQLNMMVDSGVCDMAINATIQSILNLPFIEKRRVQLADGSSVEYDVAGPIEVRFAERRTSCYAFVLPGGSEPLLGAIPMEGLDVIIHPRRQELIVNPEGHSFSIFRMKVLSADQNI